MVRAPHTRDGTDHLEGPLPFRANRNAMKQHTAVISGGAEVTPGARLLILDCPSLSTGARPGQFVMVRCGEGHDPYLRQALPIHRLTEQGIALYFRPANRHLAWLAARH